MKITATKLKQFEQYVLSFYSAKHNGIYPFNAPLKVIRGLITAVAHRELFEGDTFDRELVRNLMETLGYKEQKNKKQA